MLVNNPIGIGNTVIKCRRWLYSDLTYVNCNEKIVEEEAPATSRTGNSRTDKATCSCNKMADHSQANEVDNSSREHEDDVANDDQLNDPSSDDHDDSSSDGWQ
jgi:hypothetical protein